ncbi:MAG: FAD-dependent oxidoreductase [Gallicola sp.]|nr:FAD-dependent oxidoreductase [Gallicola sp.]
MYDVIIIGSGVAGLTAAIYARSRSLKTAVFEKEENVGGIIRGVSFVTHYPGVSYNERGDEFVSKIEDQTRDAGAEIIHEEVTKVDLNADPKVVYTNNGKYEAKKIVIANGTAPRKLDCHSEDNDTLISYDAFADSSKAFGKEVFIVGGSDGAVKESIFLASLANKVHITHQGEALTAIEAFQNEVNSKNNIEVHLNTRIDSISGESGNVTVKLRDVKTDEITEVSGDHYVFAYIGGVPNTVLYEGLDLTDKGYIVIDKNMKTNIDGVYAAGDIVDNDVRQISTAASEGTIAAIRIADELKNA